MATVKSPKKIAVPERLLAALDTVDRPGDFCCSGDTALVMPGLEVDELGTIALPLTDAHLAAISCNCGDCLRVNNDDVNIWTHRHSKLGGIDA